MPLSSTPLGLGTLEAPPEDGLTSADLPSKVGGKPAWLNLKDLPENADLACPKCGKMTVLLLQVYFPLDDQPAAFHRSVFVFACRDVQCHAGQNQTAEAPFVALRCQLARSNPFYPESIDDYDFSWRTKADASQYGDLCAACGNRGRQKCGGCRRESYCGKEHQEFDWKRGGHKRKCKGLPEVKGKCSSLLLPEFELIIDEAEEEDYAKDSDEEGEGESDAEMNVEALSNGAGVSMSAREALELERESQSKQDPQFARFRRAVRALPEQVRQKCIRGLVNVLL